MLFIFNLTTVFADTSRAALTISPRVVSEHLAQKGPETDVAFQAKRLIFSSRHPFLDVVDASKFGQVQAARGFAQFLNEHYGVRLVLAARLGELFTPIYSGLVMGSNNQIIANFKILSHFRGTETTLNIAEVTADRIERYSRNRHEFTRLAFEELRVAAGYDREARVNEIALDTSDLIDQYGRILSEMRAMLTIFDPGRPTWLLVHMRKDEDFTPHQMADLRNIPGGAIDRLLVLQPSRVMTMHEGRSNVVARGCQPDLAPDANY